MIFFNGKISLNVNRNNIKRKNVMVRAILNKQTFYYFVFIDKKKIAKDN